MKHKNQHEWGYVGFTELPVEHSAPDVLFCSLCSRYKTHDSPQAVSMKTLKQMHPNFTWQEGYGDFRPVRAGSV